MLNLQTKYQPLINEIKKALKDAGVSTSSLTLKADEYELTLCVGNYNADFDEGEKGEEAVNQFYGNSFMVAGSASGGDLKTLNWYKHKKDSDLYWSLPYN